MNMISTTFSVSIEDVIAFSMYYCDTSRTARRLMRFAHWIFPITMGIYATWLLFTERSLFFLVPLVLGMLWYLLYPLFHRSNLRRVTRKLLAEGGHKKATGEYILALSDEGLSSISPTGSSRYNWASVSRVALTDEYLFIFLAGPQGYPIRRSGFDDPTLQQIKTYIEQKMEKTEQGAAANP